jgi:hypothetical protein
MKSRQPIGLSGTADKQPLVERRGSVAAGIIWRMKRAGGGRNNLCRRKEAAAIRLMLWHEEEK